MSHRVLISGSVAYDTIMVFDGYFKDHILPDRVHMLNVSFLTPSLSREFGGCAANIAYNLKGLGGSPVVIASVGQDGGDYLARLTTLGIDTSQITRLDTLYTAQCFITTDLADNQIDAFHPGAMAQAHQSGLSPALPAALGIVAPNDKLAMQRHASELRDAGVPYIFDPGQQLPTFDRPELRTLIEGATAVTVNDYESSLLCERTGWSEQEIAARVVTLIVTRGAEGADLWTGGRHERIAACPITQAVDPTGCGDAFRGGLLYGISEGWDWLNAARLGSVMGAVKIEFRGPQNHRIDRDIIAQRFFSAYRTAPW